ncbi:MAG: hypothetical protein U5K79_14940 [Cyclobacteriaceae bacterium]|nr:hypothetical protein [Cyclobacteriaceae bacterium]
MKGKVIVWYSSAGTFFETDFSCNSCSFGSSHFSTSSLIILVIESKKLLLLKFIRQ